METAQDSTTGIEVTNEAKIIFASLGVGLGLALTIVGALSFAKAISHGSHNMDHNAGITMTLVFIGCVVSLISLGQLAVYIIRLANQPRS